ILEGHLVLDAIDVTLGPAVLEGFVFCLEIGLAPVLAQRMAGEALPHQDAAQVGMPGEANAEQIPGLAFLELDAGVDREERRRHRILARQLRLEDQARAAAGAIGVVDDFQVVLGEIVDAGDRRQIVIAVLVPQGAGEVEQTVRRDDDPAVAGAGVRGGDPRHGALRAGRGGGDGGLSHALAASGAASARLAARSLIMANSRGSIRSGPRMGTGTASENLARYQRADITDSPSIFSWTRINPCSSACGVGGHPGT